LGLPNTTDAFVRMMPANCSKRPRGPRRKLASWRALALLGATVGLNACAVGPDFKRPEVSLNAGWSASNDPRIATQAAADNLWWRGFNDPALDQLVAIAQRQNLSLQSRP
jgi:hypothetical protein